MQSAREGDTARAPDQETVGADVSDVTNAGAGTAGADPENVYRTTDGNVDASRLGGGDEEAAPPPADIDPDLRAGPGGAAGGIGGVSANTTAPGAPAGTSGAAGPTGGQGFTGGVGTLRGSPGTGTGPGHTGP